MICPHCKSQIPEGAAKCRRCGEFLVPPRGRAPDDSYGRLRFAADLSKAWAWPVVVVALLFLLRPELVQLLRRVKSLELAGAKSEFTDYAAAFGYLENRVAALANEPDATDREHLRQEIQRTSEQLRGLHPLSLGFLIELGRGVVRDDAWADPRNQPYVFDLSKRGLVDFTPAPASPHQLTADTRARLTDAGVDFLERIGLESPHQERPHQPRPGA